MDLCVSICRFAAPTIPFVAPGEEVKIYPAGSVPSNHQIALPKQELSCLFKVEDSMSWNMGSWVSDVEVDGANVKGR